MTKEIANQQQERATSRSPEEAEWLIWSFEHDAWWAPNERGYTKAVTLAGHYSRERAEEIVRRANFVSWNEAMIPVPGECAPTGAPPKAVPASTSEIAAAEQRSLERAARLEKALRRYEWLPDAHGNLCCPECFGHALHEPGCALRALLNGDAPPPSDVTEWAERLVGVRMAALEEAAQALENPTLPGDLPFREAADVVRALLSAEQKATPSKAIPESLP